MESETSYIRGVSLIGGLDSEPRGASFFGINPASGERLDPEFHSATDEDIERALSLADAAFLVLSALGGSDRAALLRGIAKGLTADGEAIVNRAALETGLSLPRLQGELARTTGQLVLFAEVLEEGSWVDARIDEAIPDRKPLPRSDIRSMLRPLGPVAVFGASNFPLAFSVMGGDTASALAAGNPVVVKAHPAHPGTSEIVGRIVQRAVQESGLPAGIFSLLFDANIQVGVSIVKHPKVKAIAFTGSRTGGEALMRLAAARPEPIPCYAEMGSTNPLFILPGAMRQRAEMLARGLQTSFTLGSGQFCTKPGLVFVPKNDSEVFTQTLSDGVSLLGRQSLLTHGIAAKYGSAVEERLLENHAQLFAGTVDKVGASDGPAAVNPAIFSISLQDFLIHPRLSEEIFGPTTLLVNYGPEDSLLRAARGLQGHLTATIHGTEEDLAEARELIHILETKVGRILFNGYPTGVEVCRAMVHGGPFPSTSDGRSTSVGTLAMTRFARQVCYQDFPDEALPADLQRANPNRIVRLLNGELLRDSPASGERTSHLL
jgi:alpha-ketoglutaric semialdehyde dehydrogenase